MVKLRRSLLWCAIGTAAACGAEPPPQALPLRGGGGSDMNTFYYNYFLDELRDAAPWAVETPGPNTWSLLSDFSFVPDVHVATSCFDRAAWPAVEIVGSRIVDGTTIGADALLKFANEPTSHAMVKGERAMMTAWMVNSAGRHDPVVLELVRGNAIGVEDATWVTWPQFALRILHAGTCAEITRQVVQFGQALTAPTTAGAGVGTRTDGFGAFASFYRDQRTALVAKVHVKGAVPAAIGAQPRTNLLMACGTGLSVDPTDVVANTAFALGNGTWVHVPGDAAAHPVQAFMTEEGRSVRLYAGAVIGDRQRQMVDLCWGSTFAHQATVGDGRVPRLERPSMAVNRLDALHATAIAVTAGEHALAQPTGLIAGNDDSRRNAFLERSDNIYRWDFVEQAVAAIERTHLGEVSGTVGSWQVAEWLATPRVRLITAAEPVTTWFARAADAGPSLDDVHSLAPDPATTWYFPAMSDFEGEDPMGADAVCGDNFCTDAESGCSGNTIGLCPADCAHGCDFGDDPAGPPAPDDDETAADPIEVALPMFAEAL